MQELKNLVWKRNKYIAKQNGFTIKIEYEEGNWWLKISFLFFSIKINVSDILKAIKDNEYRFK